jgi:hypothetical protein
MGVTTRAAAQRKAKAEATHLLDLPDEVLERILVAASDGGKCCELRSARLVCTRLRAVAYAAAREFVIVMGDAAEQGLASLEMLPRLSRLTRVQLQLGYSTGSAPFGSARRQRVPGNGG